MTSRSKTRAAWSPLLLLALGACGNLTDGSTGQSLGELALLSSSDGNDFMPISSTVQRSAITGTGTIGSVTLVYFSVPFDVAVDTVAIAPDGTPWFTKFGQLVRVAPDDSVSVMPMPSGGGLAAAIVSDGQGAFWLANWDPVYAIGRLDPTSGQEQLYSVPDPLSRPTSVGSDGQGGIWLTGGDQPIVGRLNATNHVYVVAAENAATPVTVSTAGIAIATDGQVFVSDYDGGRIGRVQGTGFLWSDLGTLAGPSGIAADVDGSAWFVSLGTPNLVGHVAHDGTVQTYSFQSGTMPDSGKSGSTIARAPDGSFWFTVPDHDQLGRVDATGQLSFVQLPAQSLPRGLAFDPSGRLWFTALGGFARLEF